MLIIAEQVEDRVESVQDSEEDQLSSTGDSEEDKSSAVETKTDGELIESLLPGVYIQDRKCPKVSTNIFVHHSCLFYSHMRNLQKH